jgi:hypothetical protein
MFGSRGGESDETVTRKTGYRIDAKRQWRGLTTADLSEIKNGEQAIEVVKVRCSLSYEKARADVQSWMSARSSNLAGRFETIGEAFDPRRSVNDNRILRRPTSWGLAHPGEWQTPRGIWLTCLGHQCRRDGGPVSRARSQSLQHRDSQSIQRRVAIEGRHQLTPAMIIAR